MEVAKKKSRAFIFIAVIVPLIAFGAMKWYDSKIADLPYFGENYTIQTAAPYFKVLPFSFTNQDSTIVTSDFVKSKIWIADYFFTTCSSICPRMTAGLGKVQAAFKNNVNVRIVSFTVDPEHDTPEQLKMYASVRNIDTHQWQLLTGSKKDLYRYARKSLFITASDGDGGAGDFIHSDKLVLIDRENHIRGYYDGTESSEIRQLINDINKLLTSK